MASALKSASFTHRGIAIIFDNVVLLILGNLLFIIFILIFNLIYGRGSIESIEPNKVEIFYRLFGIILTWLYYAFSESSAKQATLGKQALGLIVTDLEGKRISFGRATGRFFGKLPSGLILGIGYFMVFYTEKKQTLHDILAGTLVVKRPSNGFH